MEDYKQPSDTWIRDMIAVVKACDVGANWKPMVARPLPTHSYMVCWWNFIGDDVDTGKPVEMSSRKHLIPSTADKNYVVKIMFHAFLQALEHEAREQFTYKGVRVFEPHKNVLPQ
jgi:hypothetical protein